jgi:predicted dinucleotide-binding enzyme
VAGIDSTVVAVALNLKPSTGSASTCPSDCTATTSATRESITSFETDRRQPHGCGNTAIDREHAVGVIGAGHAGTAWARTALRAGRNVVIANSHGPDSLRSAVAAPGEGAVAGTVEDAVACAIVVLAVPWAAVALAVSGVDWAGRTVVDGTNPLLFPNLTPAPRGGRTSSEIVAGLVPGALLVKAGSHLPAELLGQDPVVTTLARMVEAVVVTTDWTPPTSLANRD